VCAVALLPKRKVQKPSIKLKGYQWVKLPDAKIKDTVWGGFDFQKQVKFDWNEIEEIFAANPLPTKEKSGALLIMISLSLSLLTRPCAGPV
jgi:hypothetical protein